MQPKKLNSVCDHFKWLEHDLQWLLVFKSFENWPTAKQDKIVNLADKKTTKSIQNNECVCPVLVDCLYFLGSNWSLNIIHTKNASDKLFFGQSITESDQFSKFEITFVSPPCPRRIQRSSTTTQVYNSRITSSVIAGLEFLSRPTHDYLMSGLECHF